MIPSDTAHPTVSRRQYALVAALIAAVLLVYFVAVPPAADAPLNDDWAYAQSVQHLLNEGVLHVSDWASPSLIPQIYLGALFARLAGGFSFVNLRWATLFCAVISCLALYDLLRQLGLRHAESLLGVVILLVNPLFINLTYTFMSDVFFLALMLFSLACYARGFQRRSNVWLLIGSVIAAGAYLERQLGVVLPIGVGLAWVLRDRRLNWRPLLLIGLIPVLSVLGHQLWLQIAGKSWATETLAVGSTTGFLTNPASWIIIAIRVLWSMTYLGIFTLPALLAWLVGRPSLRNTRRWSAVFIGWFIVIGVALLAFVVTNHRSMPQLANIIDHAGLGTVTLDGNKPALIPAGWLWIITLIAPLAGAAQATLWTESIVRWRRARESFSAGMILVGIGLVLAIVLFAFFYDRYLLVVVPCAAYLVLRRVKLGRWGWVSAALVSAAFLLYNVIGLSDYLGWTSVRWTTAEQLVAQGIPPERIDAGIEWIGWHEFETVLPIARATGLGNDMMAWMHVNPKTYVFAFSQLPGYDVVEEVTYPAWQTANGGHLFVLRRQ